MDIDLLRQILLLTVLLLFSAYFSGTESAFFSLSRLEQDSLKRKGILNQKHKLSRLLSDPDGILITVLTGNMIVNVIASSLAEIIGERLFVKDSEIFSIAVMTVLLLLVGEMTPKNLAVRHSTAFVRLVYVPLYYIYTIFKPIRWSLSRLNRLISMLFPLKDSSAKQKIILSTIQIGFKERILNQYEHDLFESFFSFRSKSAGDIMTPRIQAYGIEISTEISSLIKLFKRRCKMERSSLIPVYNQDMDHIEGYLDLKDLLPFKYGLKKGERLRTIIKPVLNIPASKNCADLLLEMKNTNTEMAQIVDEYGGTAGIITFRKLLKVLFSHFYTEDNRDVIRTDTGWYRIPGSFELNRLSSLLGEQIPSESRTIAGLISNVLGKIPEKNTRLVIGGIEITVVEITGNRILTVEARRLN